MAKLLGEDHVLGVKVVVGVNYFIRKISLFLILFEFPDLDQEGANIPDKIPQAHEGNILNIIFQLGQKWILAMRVPIIQIDDGKE